MYGLFVGFSKRSDGSCALGDGKDKKFREYGLRNRQTVIERFRLNAKSIISPMPDWESKRIVEITPDNLEQAGGERIMAECFITQMPNVPIAMHGNDCLAVLIADDPRTTVAAVHVPRCSLTDNFLERVIGAIREKTDNPLDAVLSPCLQMPSHNIRHYMEVIAMVERRPDVKDFMKEAEGRDGRPRLWFDYSGYAERRLKDLGVKIIVNSRIDTYTSNDFYSFRRQRTDEDGKGAGRAGLHLSIIALEPIRNEL